MVEDDGVLVIKSCVESSGNEGPFQEVGHQLQVWIMHNAVCRYFLDVRQSWCCSLSNQPFSYVNPYYTFL